MTKKRTIKKPTIQKPEIQKPTIKKVAAKKADRERGSVYINKNQTFGRPSKYTDELADRICEDLETSTLNIHKILMDNDDYPIQKIFYEWIVRHEYFRERYQKAQKLQCFAIENLMTDIINDDSEDFYHNGKALCVNSARIARDNMKLIQYRKMLTWRNKEKYVSTQDIKITNVNNSKKMSANDLKRSAMALICKARKNKSTVEE